MYVRSSHHKLSKLAIKERHRRWFALARSWHMVYIENFISAAWEVLTIYEILYTLLQAGRQLQVLKKANTSLLK